MQKEGADAAAPSAFSAVTALPALLEYGLKPGLDILKIEYAAPGGYCTTIVPVMFSVSSWKRQWYSYVPARVNVRLKLCPGNKTPELTACVPSYDVGPLGGENGFI